MLRGFSRVSRLLLAFTCVSLLAASAQASPILVDDFDGSILDDLSGSRMVLASGSFFPEVGTFEFVSDPGPQVLSLSYNNLGGLDFTAMLNTALQVTLAAIIPSGSVDLTVTATDTGANTSSFTLLNVSAGTILLPYSGFDGVPLSVFADLEKLEFSFASSTIFAIGLDDIQAVPEPGTAVLLGLGLFGLAVAGRRQAA